MMGTSAAVTRPMDLMPPTSTVMASTAVNRPVTQVDTDQLLATLAEMAVAWVRLPMPKQAMPVNTANELPSTLPSAPLLARPGEYCGPPDASPTAPVHRNRTARKASAYWVAMPTSPVTHIQNSAPGPPMAMAVATPTILPVPTVAASAVVSA